MSYETTLKLHPAGQFPSRLVATHEAMSQHLVNGLGQVATLIRLAQQLDEVTVEYNILGEDHLAGHQSVVDTIVGLAGQFAVQVLQAEVVQVIRYGLEAGGTAALGALGVTSKQKAEVMVFAAGVAFVGGYLLGELRPIRQPILRADWSPYRRWLWTEISPPNLGWFSR